MMFSQIVHVSTVAWVLISDLLPRLRRLNVQGDLIIRKLLQLVGNHRTVADSSVSMCFRNMTT